jgi:hypothetical protein
MRTLAVIVCALGLFACVETPASIGSLSANAQPPVQLILKLKGPAEGSWPETLTKLADAAGVKVRYIRPMAGGAHVIALPGHLTERELKGAMSAMAEVPEVEYVEQDRLKTHY